MTYNLHICFNKRHLILSNHFYYFLHFNKKCCYPVVEVICPVRGFALNAFFRTRRCCI